MCCGQLAVCRSNILIEHRGLTQWGTIDYAYSRYSLCSHLKKSNILPSLLQPLTWQQPPRSLMAFPFLKGVIVFLLLTGLVDCPSIFVVIIWCWWHDVISVRFLFNCDYVTCFASLYEWGSLRSSSQGTNRYEIMQPLIITGNISNV